MLYDIKKNIPPIIKNIVKNLIQVEHTGLLFNSLNSVFWFSRSFIYTTKFLFIFNSSLLLSLFWKTSISISSLQNGQVLLFLNQLIKHCKHKECPHLRVHKSLISSSHILHILKKVSFGDGYFLQYFFFWCY